ncbi:MAG TPA: L-threonylcarbamoyladenylate synthase [Streptosporangiaceae bacterium]|nr:L-threonylcarbamoyladenylate synthase [Streptosporangiaceae bacterium]
MSARFDCADPDQRAEGLAAAEAAVRRGELVVLPTDTVYGVAAEAFDPVAVEALFKAKGRGRDRPPPVLVGTVRAAMALIHELGDSGKDLIDEFWPGPLTLICRSSPTLVWDIGDSKGTVAVRMPLNQVALDLLKQTGPLAVSSAKSAAPGPMPATAAEAEAQLGDSVAVYLDGGPCPGEPSTIVDLTGSVPRLLRAGVITVDRLRDVILVAEVDDPAEDEPAGAGDEPAGAAAEGAASAVPEEAGAEPAEAAESAEASESVEVTEADGTAGAAAPAEPEPAPDTAGGAAGDTPGRGRDAGPGPTR